jgi:hypothetical protein
VGINHIRIKAKAYASLISQILPEMLRYEWKKWIYTGKL